MTHTILAPPKSDDLLEWYDKNARSMPWRIGPNERKLGEIPNPYHVWLSEIMLQQTTVAAVRDYFLKFLEKWPTIQSLANAQDSDVMAAWAGLGYYARARNLLKCARLITYEYNGVFPNSYDTLLKLPGIGPYTAAAISSIAFDSPQTVVDGNVERVMARIFAIETPLPDAKPHLTELAQKLTPSSRSGDYAQAVMDLGATICSPQNPACGICPWRAPCQAQKLGIERDLPKKRPKVKKPTRYGYAYVVRRIDGALLLELRSENGLLGGMLGWPTSNWCTTTATEDPPIHAEWKTCHAEVRHTFTHFHLRLIVKYATAPMDRVPNRGEFITNDAFFIQNLPTVFRKVYNATKDPHK